MTQFDWAQECVIWLRNNKYSKTCLKRPRKKDQKLVFKTDSHNAGQKYYRMDSAKLSTFIKLPFVFKTFVLYFLSVPA